MIEDRLYRLLLPGTVFLLFLLMFLWIDPFISLKDLLGYVAGVPVTGLPITVLGGGLLLTVVGYACGEIAFVTNFIKPEKNIPDDLISRMCRSIGVPHTEDRTKEEVVVYTHVLLDKCAPGAKAYLQRSWSHIVIAKNSIVAVVLAFVAWTAIEGWSLAICCERNSPPIWQVCPGFSCSEIGRCIVLLAIPVVSMWMLYRSASKQKSHRKRIYEVLTECSLIKLE